MYNFEVWVGITHLTQWVKILFERIQFISACDSTRLLKLMLFEFLATSDFSNSIFQKSSADQYGAKITLEGIPSLCVYPGKGKRPVFFVCRL